MKKVVVILMLLLLILHGFSVAATADASQTAGCSTLQAKQSLAGSEKYTGTAKAAILYELNTQTLVLAHNPDASINPTGLVKILTALIVLEEGNLDDVVTVKRSTLNSVGPGAVSAGLKAGEEISLRNLLYCVMVSSANDAAAVMAEYVAGSQTAFVEKMNRRAATLGCANTVFTNVHGLMDDRQRSSARDLAIITEEALKNQQFRELFGLTQYTMPATNMSEPRNLKTTNYMMDPDRNYFDERVTGGKPAAATTTDRSLICTAQTENGNYLCVIISAKARTSGSSVTRYTNFDEAKKLLSFGFDDFAVQQVLGPEQPYGLFPVADGENHAVVSADQPVYALLPAEFDPGQLRFEEVRNEQALCAPLRAGAIVGSLKIYYGSVNIGQAALIARHDVASVGSTIQYVSEAENTSSGIGVFLKWTVIFIGILLIIAAAGLVTLRYINVYRHKQAKAAKAKERRGI
jgi:D-alanyl-D-alanine carboxypeptidase (penicillin-binding protein 5/6)